MIEYFFSRVIKEKNERAFLRQISLFFKMFRNNALILELTVMETQPVETHWVPDVAQQGRAGTKRERIEEQPDWLAGDESASLPAC